MLKKYKSMSISQIQKILLKKGFKILRLKKNPIFSNYKNLYLTTFLSIFLIGFFSVLPTGVNFIFNTFKQNKVVENYSKKYLEKVLSGENLVSENNNDDILDDTHLYEDIEIETGPSLSVRIEASILNQVFEDDGYTLKQVRKNKLVKPFEVGMLPEELKQIESSKIRKDLFIKIVLPLVLSENNRIKRDRTTLFKILNKNNNTKSEKDWLKKKFKQYGVVSKDLSTLKIRMDIIPVSLAIAQAAKETGWGTSRFAIEGNALFGQWTFSGKGIKPAGSDKNDKHKVATFSVLKASVRAYQRNLNTHSSYKEFRKARAIQRDNDENLNSLELANFLNEYAETGEEYTKTIKKIIQQNSLKDFDNAKILPTNIEGKNNI
tara:strand:+ start:2223 stop:3353 length:1131 start_codon:yes stop_codon:yes gene_type:complete